jgi:hypothetical protein
MTSESTQDYYRRDQSSGITAPNLAKCCSYAEHIVSARGKRDQYTSVSLDPKKIHGFGDKLYRLLREKLPEDGHDLVEHDILLSSLRQIAATGDKADKTRALRALRYATKRKEGLICWRFDICSIETKDIISWTFSKVQTYFVGA